LAISNGKFMGKKGKAKICLREGRDWSTEDVGKIVGNIRVDTNGKKVKGSLMVVNREPSCQLKIMQDVLGRKDGPSERSLFGFGNWMTT
jgi:hypothetical protein